MKNYEIKLNDKLHHLPELKTKTVDGKRHYVTPEGKSLSFNYYSIIT